MVNIAIVGIGFMGLIHYLAYQKIKNAKVLAIVSRNPQKRNGDWRDIKGNFGPKGTVVDLKKIKTCENLDEILSDDSIDLVDICLPTFLHADAAIKSLEAQKHVLCEKPISLSLSDSQKMIGTSKAQGKMLMIGHVLPFFPAYAYLKTVKEQGIFGALKGGFFRRIISDPTWIPDFYIPSMIGGPLFDIGIHESHFIRILCGMPYQVFSCGWMRGDVPEYTSSAFIYPHENPYSISAISGVIQQQGRPFTQSFEVYFEDATVLFDYANINGKTQLSMPLTVLKKDGTVENPNIGTTEDPVHSFISELTHVVEALETNTQSNLLDASLARDALLMCYKQIESIRTQQPLRI